MRFGRAGDWFRLQSRSSERPGAIERQGPPALPLRTAPPSLALVESGPAALSLPSRAASGLAPVTRRAVVKPGSQSRHGGARGQPPEIRLRRMTKRQRRRNGQAAAGPIASQTPGPPSPRQHQSLRSAPHTPAPHPLPLSCRLLSLHDHQVQNDFRWNLIARRGVRWCSAASSNASSTAKTSPARRDRRAIAPATMLLPPPPPVRVCAYATSRRPRHAPQSQSGLWTIQFNTPRPPP